MDATSIKEKVFKAVREALIEKDEEIVPETDASETLQSDLLSVDLFSQKFISKGGSFLYCEKSKDIIQGVMELFRQTDLSTILCLDEELAEVLEVCNVKYTKTVSKDQKIDFIITQADALIANNGSIVVSFNSEDENIVVYSGAKLVLFSGTDQLVNRYSDISKVINSKEHSRKFSNTHIIEKPSTKSKLEFPIQTYLFLRHVK